MQPRNIEPNSSISGHSQTISAEVNSRRDCPGLYSPDWQNTYLPAIQHQNFKFRLTNATRPGAGIA